MHDNIVPKPDLALELGKSISLTEAEEEAVAREVHATHARIVSESEPEPTQRRQFGIAFRDSFIVSKFHLPTNAAYSSRDLDAYDSACDEHQFKPRLLLGQSLKEWLRMAHTESSETIIPSDSNIIPYSQYLSETHQETV
ncbi:hypothetical protein Tco_0123770 [Tanacetum coccineum]